MIKLTIAQPEYQTIVLKRIGRRHKRLKIVLKWLVFYNAKTGGCVKARKRHALKGQHHIAQGSALG